MLAHLPTIADKNIIWSSADKMKKNYESQFKVQQSKLKTNAEKFAEGCSQGEQSNNDNKKCQENMRPVKLQMNMWLAKPATVIRLCKEATCQSTRCYKKHSDPKKRQKMQYKVQYSWSVNQEYTTLDVTSEKLSPRCQKPQVSPKYKYREDINV